jgi:hypothetical protein
LQGETTVKERKKEQAKSGELMMDCANTVPNGCATATASIGSHVSPVPVPQNLVSRRNPQSRSNSNAHQAAIVAVHTY